MPSKRIDNMKGRLIILGIVAAVALISLNWGWNFCARVGGLWCYDPLQSVNYILNGFLIIVGVAAFVLLIKLFMKGSKKKK